MTGGLAFIVDDEAWLNGGAPSSPKTPLINFINKETVTVVPLSPAYTAAKQFLADILKQHVTETDSARAKRCLQDLDTFMSKVTMLVPASEKANPLAQADVTNSVSAKTNSNVV